MNAMFEKNFSKSQQQLRQMPCILKQNEIKRGEISVRQQIQQRMAFSGLCYAHLFICSFDTLFNYTIMMCVLRSEISRLLPDHRSIKCNLEKKTKNNYDHLHLSIFLSRLTIDAIDVKSSYFFFLVVFFLSCCCSNEKQIQTSADLLNEF